MSSKRGLSLEEKRQKMLEIFFEKRTFFQLKDLEKIAPKEKGITSMSVKDVLQSLVDDSLVDSERIGTSNYFWAYPSKALHTKKRKVEQLQAQSEEAQARISANDTRLVAVAKGREVNENRENALAELQNLESENKRLKMELDRYKECDPEILQDAKRLSEAAVEAANRWTDNVFAIKSWCKQKFSMDSTTIDKQFGIPEDFDYIE